MKRMLLAIGVVCGMAVAVLGSSNTVIQSFAGNGVITWTNGVPDAHHRIEWASSLNGPWSSSWESLEDIALGTNSLMSASVPMFYRIADCTHDYIVVDLSEGPAATNYPVSFLGSTPAAGWPDAYKTTKLVMRHVPAGTFIIGAATNEVGRDLDDKDEPQREVTLTRDFYAGIFEVTQKQWERVMGTWPSYASNVLFRDSRPVEAVSYLNIRGADQGADWPSDSAVDTNSFMGLLRAKTGWDFDLPTDAQWEYACRAGISNSLNTGYNLTNELIDVHMDEAGRYWYNGGSGYLSNDTPIVASSKVGSYLPNAWGLYDMHGNVWEWALDWYTNSPSGPLDPLGPVSGANRVARGGGFLGRAGICRSAARTRRSPAVLNDNALGFRLFITLP